MALDDFLDEFENGEIEGLADQIARGEVPEETEERIANQFREADDDELRNAIDRRPALERLLAGLGIPTPEPEPEELFAEVTPETAREDVERLLALDDRPPEWFRTLAKALREKDATEFQGQLDQEVIDALTDTDRRSLARQASNTAERLGPTEELEGVPEGERERPTRGFGGRPDPRFGEANLSQRFPQPDIRAQFKKLETVRRNLEDERDEDISPGDFWDEYTDQVIPGATIITKAEFVEAEQSPGATGMFK